MSRTVIVILIYRRHKLVDRINLFGIVAGGKARGKETTRKTET
jgi:hypothetical protein